MSSLKDGFPFRVTVQMTLPSRQSLPEFTEKLALLSSLGFYGVELNLPELTAISPDELKALLDGFGLTLTYIATGAYAKVRGFSLSTADEKRRLSSIQGALENLRYAGAMNAGIILGFFKGGPEADCEDNSTLFERSVKELCMRNDAKTPILAEATNRRETCVLRNLDEGAALCDHIGDPSLYVLPDTYHMFFEEKDPALAVKRHLRLIRNIHISDSNRFFPGFGDIDFASFLNMLISSGYAGTIGIEGNLKRSFSEDITACADHLSCLALG